MSNIKVGPGKVKYVINEADKTVVAIVQDCKKDLISYLIEEHGMPFGVTIRNEDLFLNSSYMGRCTVHGNDVFDVELGKKIARRKAVRKYRNAVCKVWHRYVMNLGEKYARIGNLLEEDYIVSDQNYIDTMQEVL